MKRNGQNSLISSDELLVGDILQINIGDIIGVDGILINGNGLNFSQLFLKIKKEFKWMSLKSPENPI